MKTKKIFSALLAVCMLVSIMAIVPASATDYAANPITIEGSTVYAGEVNVKVVLREYSTWAKSKYVINNADFGTPDGGDFVLVTFYLQAGNVAIHSSIANILFGYNTSELTPIKKLGSVVAASTNVSDHMIVDPLMISDGENFPYTGLTGSKYLEGNKAYYVISPSDAALDFVIQPGQQVALCAGIFQKKGTNRTLYKDSFFYTYMDGATSSYSYKGIEIMQHKMPTDMVDGQYEIPEAYTFEKQVVGTDDQFVALTDRPAANPKVVSVGTVAANNVANGTSWATAIAGLATSVTATTDAATNNSTTATIAWNTTAPAGYGNGATGTYTATGTLTFPAGIDANGHTSISATVNVAAPEVIEIETPVIIEDTTPAAMESTIIAAATAAGATGGVSVNYTGVTNGQGKIIGGQYTKNDKIVGFIKDGVTFEVKNAEGQVISTGTIDVTYGSNATDAKKFEKTGAWDGDAAVSSVVANDKATVSAYAPAGSKFKLELNMGKGFGRTIVTVRDADQNIVAVDRLDTFFVANTSESFIIQNQATHTDFVAATTGVYTVEVEVNGTNISDLITGIGEASNKITISAFEIVPVV